MLTLHSNAALDVSSNSLLKRDTTLSLKRVITRKKYVPSDGITQSMLATFLACRQRSRFHIDGWESLFSDGAALGRGTLLHSILENHYRNFPGVFPAATLQDTSKEWIKGQNKKNSEQKHIDDSVAFVYSVFPPYTDFYRKRDLKYNWESLEEVFDLMWKGYRLRGKIDGVAIINGSRWIFETKTMAQINEDALSDKLEIDFQNLFYLTALKALERPVTGIIYNVIRKSSLKQKKKETLDEFKARQMLDVRTRMPHYFKRFQVTYTQTVVNRFEAELEYKLADFVAWCSGKIPTYRNETSCITRTKCPFLKACASGSLIGYKQTRELFRELKPE